MLDSHCHLWFKHFRGEIPEVIERAKKAGIDTMLCVGCDEESSRRSVEIAKEYEGILAAIGLHPGDSDKWDEEKTLAWLRVLLELNPKKVVAIGEIGIDYYHQPYDKELQKKMFREQCLLAQEFAKPVIIHLRNAKTRKNAVAGGKEHFSLEAAELDCLHVLEELGMQDKKVLFHCFSGNRMLAEAVLERGWYLSFAGPVTYPQAQELCEVVKITPVEKMLLETDCPFLAPQKYRGKRNEPAYVVETAQKVAQLKALNFPDLEQQIAENFAGFFALNKTKSK